MDLIPILDKFVDEINNLHRNGFVVDLPGTGSRTVYASLCQVTCDNLALNSMLGFIESFSADFFALFAMQHRKRFRSISGMNCLKSAQLPNIMKMLKTLIMPEKMVKTIVRE
jgi:hypothetical protein